MSLHGKGKSLCRGCRRRARNNTPCPSARPSRAALERGQPSSSQTQGTFTPLLSSLLPSSSSLVLRRRVDCPPPSPTRSLGIRGLCRVRSRRGPGSVPLRLVHLPNLGCVPAYFWFITPSRKASRSKLGEFRSWAAVTCVSRLAPTARQEKEKERGRANSPPDAAAVLAAAGCFDLA